MMWISLIAVALIIAWLASTAVRKQKRLANGPRTMSGRPVHPGEEVGQRR